MRARTLHMAPRLPQGVVATRRAGPAQIGATNMTNRHKPSLSSVSLPGSTGEARGEPRRARALAVLCMFWLASPAAGTEAASAADEPDRGPGFVVQSAFGGRIFGFDIDQNGNEG